MSILDKTAEGNRFIKERQFFPTLNDWIDKSDSTYERKAAKKVFIKAYLLAATGGSAFFSCTNCGFHNAIAHTARALNTTAATVGLAFEVPFEDSKRHHCVFCIASEKIEVAHAICKSHKLDEITRVRLSCRAGVGMLSIAEIFPAPALCDNYAQELDDFVRLPEIQVAQVCRRLDRELQQFPGNYKLAAQRARYDSSATSPGDFGDSVFRQLNQLLAAGHDPNA